MTKQQQQGQAGRAGKGGGDAVAAAAAADEGPLGRRGLVDRRQFLRLLEQSLAALGYSDIAEQLERASGVASQPPQVRLVQDGDGGSGFGCAVALLCCCPALG